MTVDIHDYVHAVLDHKDVLRQRHIAGKAVRVTREVWDAAQKERARSRLEVTTPAQTLSICNLPVLLDPTVPPGRIVIVTDQGDVVLMVTDGPPTIWERLIG